MKIGRYTDEEILDHLTEGEGRGFLGRSMFDAMYFKIEELENQLQQKENIIKEVREYTKEMQVYCIEFESWGVPSKELLEIVKDSDKE